MPAPQLVNTGGGSVPSQSGGGSTVNPNELLSSIMSSTSQNLQKYALEAATPIPGGSQGQMPASMDATPKEAPQGQLDHREVVGKGNARAQGIGNAVIGAMNAISSISTAVDNKKRLKVATATQQVLTAQAAANQAKQILQTDPENAQAKEQLAHNQQIMQGVLSDDSLRKAIGKGFNINFTDPSQNNTPDHQAVAEGKEMAKKSLSYAEQFDKGTPETMVPNQQAIAKYQAAAAAQKSQTDIMKAMVPLITASMRAETAEHQIQGRMDQEKFRQAATNARQLMHESNEWDRLTGKIMADKALAKDKFGYAMAEIGQRAAVEMKNFRTKAALAKNDPIALQKSWQAYDEKSTAELSNIAKNIVAMENQKSEIMKRSSGDKQGQLAAIDAQLNTAKEQQAAFQRTVKANQDYYQAIIKAGGQNGGPDSSGADAARRTVSEITSASFWAGDSPSDSVPDDESDPDNN